MKNLFCFLVAVMVISCQEKTKSDDQPTVTTTAITNINGYSATSGGNVASDGGDLVTARGVCWSTSHDPIVTGNHTSDDIGVGAYVSSITGLSPNTQYYVRAYATNGEGTAYGEEIGFSTNSTQPTVTTAAISGITVNSATGGGNVLSDSGSAVTARGVCWSTSQNPTIANSHTTDGSGTGAFVSSITGLLFHTNYYVRAYATNSAGTKYGNQNSFTTSSGLPVVTTTSISDTTYNSANGGGNVTTDSGATVTARGLCWKTSPNPTIANSKTTDGSGTGLFSSFISNLSPSTTYYVKAYATNSVGTNYGAELSFTTTPPVPPTVTTASITNITTLTANGGGNVTVDGGATVNARGVCWSTTQNPTVADNKTIDGTGTGLYASLFTGLSSLTTYYVRAYAINSSGTSYGDEVTFTASSDGTKSTFIDSRDGQVYQTVVIGSQIWMAENLNYSATGSSGTYGRLYDLSAALTVAPLGWHLPTEAEWTTLATYLGGTSVAGGKLKEMGTLHWSSPNTDATDEVAFTGLPGGVRLSNGTLQDVSNYGFWWSTSGKVLTMYYNDASVGLGYSNSAYGFSVRCIKD